ncbi:MAG: hypothetical protein Tsb0020_25750 [Haliangiales bacterium]
MRRGIVISILLASVLAGAGCALDDAGNLDEVEKDLSRDADKEPRLLRYDDLPAAPEYATRFVLQGNSWDHTNITYFFQNGTGDIASTAEQQAVRDAFAMWAEVTPLTFTELGTTSVDIIIRWATGGHGDGYDFDGTHGVLAHAFYPPPNGTFAGDIHFDDAELWTLNIRTNGGQPIDLVTVAAHEIGHALGLAHSGDADAIMAPFYTGSQRFLDDDDINGIQALYGATGPVIQFLFPDYTGCQSGSARYVLTWSLASGGPVLEYDLDRSKNGSTWSARYNGTSTSAFDLLNSDTRYFYRVRARDADGWGAFKQIKFWTEDCSGGGGPPPL